MKKKISFWSIAFGCTLFSAVLGGTWFLFSAEIKALLQASEVRHSNAISSASNNVQSLDEKNNDDRKEKEIESQISSIVTDTQKQNTAEEVLTEEETEKVEKQSVVEDQEYQENQKNQKISVIEKEDGVKEAKEETKQFSGPSCAQTSPVLTSFFNSIERKGYREKFNIQQPLFQHFNALTKKLFAASPVVIRETDELYTILTNMAHLFRILGKEDILLIKRVLVEEKNNVEEVAAALYALIDAEPCFADNVSLNMPLAKMYEYAGFFLNTMGGRAYIFRRDSKVRLLISYYAILVVEQANRKNLNPYGLDITEPLPRLIQDIASNNQLARKEEYLERLYELAEKYEVLL